MADLADAPEVCIRPMAPTLMQPMAVASLQAGTADPAVVAVLEVIDLFRS